MVIILCFPRTFKLTCTKCMHEMIGHRTAIFFFLLLTEMHTASEQRFDYVGSTPWSGDSLLDVNKAS